MKHRIVVLGFGRAGAYAAGSLARRLSPADTDITVVNAEPDFVQRLRLDRLAAGQEIVAPHLADVSVGAGVRLGLARVTAVEPETQVVAVAENLPTRLRDREPAGPGRGREYLGAHCRQRQPASASSATPRS
jgi:NADH dehydrogenase FAD-containing subunit